MEDLINNGLTPVEINDMETKRLEMLDEAEINENAVLGHAKENINIWYNYFNENQTRGKDDLNFVLRDQWTAIERSEFTRLFKPAMTFNKLYDATKKIAGEQRKNKPDLLVRSLTGKATQEQINLREDLVRTISYQSQNDLIYQAAFKSALMMGYGCFQVNIDYESPYSFNQVIKFELINDPTRVAFDPVAMKPHKGDGNYFARMHVFSKQEFEATYPYILNPVNYYDPRYLLDFQWETRDTVVVCDYQIKEWYSKIIYKLSNGMVVTKEEWEDLQKQFALRKQLARDAIVVGGLILDEIPKVVMERQTQDYKIMRYILTKDKIIDFSEWPSKFLGGIFVDGDSYFMEGRQYTRSFIHEARDAQKLLNYTRSETAAELKNRRREQWIGTPDNIIGYEQDWRNPELQMAMLRAKPDPQTKQMPQKMPAWEISQGLFVTAQAVTQDIKEILGFSETEALQGRDISGKARRERKMEGSMSAYVYFDNLNQAIEQAGRVVLDLLPTIYGGEERHIIVSKPDGRTQSLIINEKMPDGQIKNELTAGDYDIEIDSGPSFAVQKEIALEFLQNTLQAFPQAFPLVADLWAKNLDVQFMPQMAERFKTMVPPDIVAKEEGLPPPPKTPSPEQQAMQMQQELHQAQLKERADELRIRQEKHELEKAQLMLDAKELAQKAGIDQMKSHTELKKADMNFSAQLMKILADLNKP